VYKQFPLPFQAQSEPAARASLAAKEQGKFWEMYDLLYENQRNLAQDGLFERLAGQIGLNVEKFKADMDSPKIIEQVKAEHAEGSAVGVRGTPAFFINGNRLVGAQPIERFKEVIDAELAKK
jgi:protein-disulfide isomerase